MGEDYRYFISYSHSEGFGNLEISLTRSIEDINDLRSIAKGIEKATGNTSIAIIFYRLLGEGEEVRD